MPKANRTKNLRPFKPGQSGNPGGRPKGFAARIKDACGGDDYPQLVSALAVIAFGAAKDRRAFFGEDMKVTTRDRLTALSELGDRGPGRPTQAVNLDVQQGRPLFNLPPDSYVKVTDDDEDVTTGRAGTHRPRSTQQPGSSGAVTASSADRRS